MEYSSLTLLEGGWSGETFLAEAAGVRSVVRIYARPGPRGDRAHEVDAALLGLVRGLLPVPEVLEVRRADPAAGTPALLVTSFLPGTRADLLLPRLVGEQRARLGTALGRLAADLGGMPLLRRGPFLDGDLAIGVFPGPDDLPGWVAAHLGAFTHWSERQRTGLRRVAGSAQALLDGVTRACLVHSDFNLKNLLVDPETLEVTGLVDWEFAHAGHPFTDLGNLLRFERDEVLTTAVLDAYTARHEVPAPVALDLARAADLWALVDLAARAPDNPVTRAAHDLLRAVAAERALHAVP